MSTSFSANGDLRIIYTKTNGDFRYTLGKKRKTRHE